MLLFTSNLEDYNIVATDGELGKIKDLYVDEQKWDLRYVSIDTRKWLPGKKVLLSPSSITGVNEEEKQLEVKYDKETVRNSPDVPEETQLSRETEQQLNEYYGWGPTLADPIMYGGGQMPTINLIRTPQTTTTEPLHDPVNPEDELRSGDEVIGFRVHANNGKLGNVADFIYDDTNWKIRYVVVESSDSILNPKYYVYNTDLIESANWLEGDLYMSGSLETLEKADLFINKEDIVASLI